MPHTAGYLELKSFLRFFTERFGDARALAPEARPLALVEAQERDDPERAAAGLRMAVNDCMELSGHWPLARVTAVDAELRSKGLLSLSEVRQRVWGRYAAIVKHAQLRNEAEYQVVKAVLADQALAASLPAAERDCLLAVSVAFEKKRPAARTTGSPRSRSRT